MLRSRPVDPDVHDSGAVFAAVRALGVGDAVEVIDPLRRTGLVVTAAVGPGIGRHLAQSGSHPQSTDVLLGADLIDRLRLAAPNTAPGTWYPSVTPLPTIGLCAGRHDRPAGAAVVVRELAAPDARSVDFCSPGPVRAALSEAGRCRDGFLDAAAAALELLTLAGRAPIVVVLGRTGRDDPSRSPSGTAVPRVTVSTVAVSFTRLSSAPLHADSGWTRMPTVHGMFRARAYESRLVTGERLVLTGAGRQSVDDLLRTGPVTAHRECPMGHLVDDRRCRCRRELEQGLTMLAARERGALVYIRRERTSAALASCPWLDPASPATSSGSAPIESGLLSSLIGSHREVRWGAGCGRVDG